MTSPFLSNDNTDLFCQIIETIGKASLGLLISGENGLGKEALVRLLYARSPYGGYPFIKINCPMLSGSGVTDDTPCIRELTSQQANSNFSLFRLFHQGVLYLHAVDELEMELQRRLLVLIKRKLQASCLPPGKTTGGILILSTATRPIESCVASGTFLPALGELLSGLSIHIPPLRHSPERISPLVDHFLNRYALYEGNDGLGHPSDSHLAILKSNRWLGNVKQLQELVIRALRLNDWGAAIGMLNSGMDLLDNDTAVNLTADGIALIPEFEITHGHMLEQLSEDSATQEMGLMDLLFYEEVVSNNNAH